MVGASPLPPAAVAMDLAVAHGEDYWRALFDSAKWVAVSTGGGRGSAKTMPSPSIRADGRDVRSTSSPRARRIEHLCQYHTTPILPTDALTPKPWFPRVADASSNAQFSTVIGPFGARLKSAEKLRKHAPRAIVAVGSVKRTSVPCTSAAWQPIPRWSSARRRQRRRTPASRSRRRRHAGAAPSRSTRRRGLPRSRSEGRDYPSEDLVGLTDEVQHWQRLLRRGAKGGVAEDARGG